MSDELKKIVDMIQKYMDENPDASLIFSIRNGVEEGAIAFFFDEEIGYEDMIGELITHIDEWEIKNSGEPYGKFFNFNEFYASYN